MASSLDHLRQWQHNRDFLAIIPGKYPDWVVTVAFYSALHVVDAVLSAYQVTTVSHESRNLVLSKTNRYLKIRECYLPMYTLSRTIRYLANPQQWVPSEKIETHIFERYLYPIEQSARGLLKDRGVTMPDAAKIPAAR